MARPSEPRDLVPWLPPPPPAIAPLGPTITAPLDTHERALRAAVPPSYLPPPAPIVPMVPVQQSGLAPEFIRNLQPIGSGAGARMGYDETGADWDVPADVISRVNRYYPYSEPPPYVPPPNPNIFRPDVRLDTGPIDDRRRQAPAARLLAERTALNRGDQINSGNANYRPKPSYSLAREQPLDIHERGGGRDVVMPPAAVDTDQRVGERSRFIPPAAPPRAMVPLRDIYGPMADAYRKGGPQDYVIGDIDIPEETWQERFERQVAEGKIKSPVPTSSYASQMGGFNARNAVLGQNPFGRVLSGENLLRIVGSGSSAFDLITIHADALIPGPGQNTLKNRFDLYRRRGLAADQAANATMKDYGDALQQVAEDPSFSPDARWGAQFARVLGTVQSIVAPAPVPGGASLPIGLGLMRRAGGEGAEAFGKALAQAKVGQKVVVGGREGVIDGVRAGGKLDVKFAGDEIAKPVRVKDVEAIEDATVIAAGAGERRIADVPVAIDRRAQPLTARIAAHEAGKAATAAPGAPANAALAAAKGTPAAPGTGSALKPGSTPAAVAAKKAAAPPTATPVAGAAAPPTPASIVPPAHRAAIAAAATDFRNAMTRIKPRDTTGPYGGATTKAEKNEAQRRLVELNRQRGVTGGKIVNEPPVTRAAGGNKPKRGMQLQKYPPEVQPFMDEVAKELEPFLQGAVRKLSDEDILTASQMTGETIKKTASRLAKRGTTSVDIQAVRIGVTAKTKIAMELASRVAAAASTGQVAAKDMYDALTALQEAVAIQATLHEAASEAGRTLRVLRTQIDPSLVDNPTGMAYMAAVSRIARDPQQAQAIMTGLLAIGDDPVAISKLLRGMNRKSPLEALAEVVNLPRGMRASLDVSFPGRQGVIIAVADPVAGKEMMVKMFQALRSDAVANAIENAQRSSPMFAVRRKAGLYHAEWGSTASVLQRDEAMISTGLLGELPGFLGAGYRASDRSFAIAGNVLRDTHFDNMLVGWQRAGVEVSDYRAQLLASWLNIATGRGDLPAFMNQAMPLLAGIFFSPRFAISRFQAITYAPTQAAKAGFRAGRTAIGKGSADDMAKAADEIAMAKVAAQDMVRFVSAGVGVMMLTKAASRALGGEMEIEPDPRSPEFGKMKFGNMVVDLWGGEQQVVRNVAQYVTQQKKTVTGDDRGKIIQVPREEVIGRFIRGKLAPTAATLWDMQQQIPKGAKEAAAGKAPWDQPIATDFLGQAYSAKDLATSTGQSLWLPMSWGDIVEAIMLDREEGGSGLRGLAVGGLSLLGAGVTTYGSEESGGQRATPRRSSSADVSPFRR